MTRLFRWFFNFVALMSAVLFVGVCVLWLRGWRRMDVAVWRLGDVTIGPYPVDDARMAVYSGRTGGTVEVDSVGGELVLCRLLFHSAHGLDIGGPRTGSWPVPSGAQGRDYVEPAEGKGVRFLGFWVARVPFRDFSVEYVIVPCWAAVLLAAALPAARLWSRRMRLRRRGLGLCPACGYDLRATPDRCPECGAVPKRA